MVTEQLEAMGGLLRESVSALREPGTVADGNELIDASPMFGSVDEVEVAPGVRLHLRWPDPDRPMYLSFGGDGAALHFPRMCQPRAASPSELVDELPDGHVAVQLQAACEDPVALGDGDVVDAIVVFERLQGWVGAQQARLLAEFGRRRPAHDPDAAPVEDSVGVSRYAADERAPDGTVRSGRPAVGRGRWPAG